MRRSTASAVPRGYPGKGAESLGVIVSRQRHCERVSTGLLLLTPVHALQRVRRELADARHVVARGHELEIGPGLVSADRSDRVDHAAHDVDVVELAELGERL